MSSANSINRQTVGLNVRLVRMFKWIRKRISDSDDSGWLAEVFPARSFFGICDCHVVIGAAGIY